MAVESIPLEADSVFYANDYYLLIGEISFITLSSDEYEGSSDWKWQSHY